PGISTAHLYKVVVEKDYQSIGGQLFMDVFERILTRSAAAFPEVDPVRLRLIQASVISAILFMMLAPGYFNLAGEARHGCPEGRRALAEHFTRMYYAALNV
ncbi:MAG: hypothetical protein JXB35_05495, partial [Anaerolineae bacterium]|nr:hypothetical protein [Anaerolineae bacterium]